MATKTDLLIHPNRLDPEETGEMISVERLHASFGDHG